MELVRDNKEERSVFTTQSVNDVNQDSQSAQLMPPPFQLKIANEGEGKNHAFKELSAHPLQAKEDSQNDSQNSNNTGLPNDLKTGIEAMSGYSLDDVKVHYNSSQPAQLQAHAYAQGSEIHVGPGQEKHLPHEAWHVVQQKQGRVSSTAQLKGNLSMNDDESLEREADVQGERAMVQNHSNTKELLRSGVNNPVIQGRFYKPSTNKVDRPSESEAVRAAKEEAKTEAALRGEPDAEFTAHHKYPWNKIAEDIEEAFTVPRTRKTTSTLRKLETFSGKSFPVTIESFLNSTDHRATTYSRKETLIDRWLSDVCWVPANIFIGPLSNNRVDDPSKRGEDSDFDAHYTRRRRMSLRSDQLLKIFEEGGLKDSSDTGEIKGSKSVAKFDPAEWSKVAMGEGEVYGGDMFVQKDDPYAEENIFPYVVSSANAYNFNHAADTYDLEITTPDDVKRLGIKYDHRIFRPTKETKPKQVEMPSAAAAGQLKWTSSLPIPKGSAIENVKLVMLKTNGKKKEIEIDSIKLTHR